mgnify:CR=1 FL=1
MVNMLNNKQWSKKGMVSIFVVIFTTMLIGIIALGFVRQMLLDQQRAINSDLADSAYDSAMAGIADAKRAIVHYEREICANGASGECLNLLKSLNGSSETKRAFPCGQSTSLSMRITVASEFRAFS